MTRGGSGEHDGRPDPGALLGLAGRGPRAGWFYVGRRPARTEVFVVGADSCARLEHREHRSPAAFDWGARAPWTGRLELAFALLADVTAHRPPEATTFTLYRSVVSRLERDGWVLSDVDLLLWIYAEGENPLDWAPWQRRGAA